MPPWAQGPTVVIQSPPSLELTDLLPLECLRLQSQVKDLPLSALGLIAVDDNVDDMDQLGPISIRRAGTRERKHPRPDLVHRPHTFNHPYNTDSLPLSPPPSPRHSSTSDFSLVQDIFRKHNIILEPEDWHRAPPLRPRADRVKKSTRVRLKRVCHECQATFSHSKTCTRCQHRACSECVRLPCLRSATVDKIPARDIPTSSVTAVAGERKQYYERLHGQAIQPRARTASPQPARL